MSNIHKVKKSMTLDSDVMKRIEEIAKVENRSISQQVNYMLQLQIEIYDKSAK